jgi:hypothetical protein
MITAEKGDVGYRTGSFSARVGHSGESFVAGGVENTVFLVGAPPPGGRSQANRKESVPQQTYSLFYPENCPINGGKHTPPIRSPLPHSTVERH